jgi:hypothetical protein
MERQGSAELRPVREVRREEQHKEKGGVWCACTARADCDEAGSRRVTAGFDQAGQKPEATEGSIQKSRTNDMQTSGVVIGFEMGFDWNILFALKRCQSTHITFQILKKIKIIIMMAKS